jgi:hypothetical protein
MILWKAKHHPTEKQGYTNPIVKSKAETAPTGRGREGDIFDN